MSIDETDTVDFIGVETASGLAVLTISDHLDWADSGAHQRQMAGKINTYLNFAAGEMLTAYPDAAGRDLVISVMAKHPPDQAGHDFLERMRSGLRDMGLAFRYELLPASAA
jgi:hypothetical protein